MLRLLLVRLMQIPVIIIAMSLLVFIFLNASGDPAQLLMPTEATEQDIEEMRRNRTVIGTPQQCIERMSELGEACGLSGWSFEISYGGMPPEMTRDQMQLFAEEVIPVLRP